MTPLSIWSSLDTIKDSLITEYSHAFIDTAAALACIFGAWSVLSTARDFIRGAEIDLWDVLKPVAIVILVMNFNTLALKPVELVTKIAGRAAVTMTDTRDGAFVRKWSESLKQMAVANAVNAELDYEEELKEIASDRSAFGRFFSKTGLAMKKVVRQMLGVKSLTFAGMVGGILFMLAKALMFLQWMICYVYIVLNSLLGSFSLAMSMLRPFSNSFHTWAARHIQIMLWVPMGLLVMAVALGITSVAGNVMVAREMDLGMEWMMIGMQIVTIVSIASVPKLVGWPIDSSGTNDAHGSLSHIGKAAIRKVAKL